MSRTAVYSALVLRNRPSGESNSEITLLTGEEGLVRATVFGGPKNRLRAHCAPYNSGKAWIYRDKSKEYAKLSDFDVQFWRAGLRELYERTMAAGAVAETILSTHGGGGEWEAALKIAAQTLDALENANEELCSRLLVHFLWRWTHLLGIQPLLECGSCGGNSEGAFWYNIRENSALCASCLQGMRDQAAPTAGAGEIQINPGCRRWLSAAGTLEPSLLHRFSMDNKSLSEAKALTTAVLAGALGKRLPSWDWQL